MKTRPRIIAPLFVKIKFPIGNRPPPCFSPMNTCILGDSIRAFGQKSLMTLAKQPAVPVGAAFMIAIGLLRLARLGLARLKG